MNAIRNTAAAILLALAGWLAVPTPPTAADIEPARCAGAVEVAYAALAREVTPPAPPTPPAPEAPCGGKCSGGTFKPDGRIPMECPADCPCGCRANRPGKLDSSPRCGTCLGTRLVQGADLVIRPCRSCCPSGTCPAR
jgi:hypothetical protein